MNFAQEKQGASRFTGLGVVILIHVLIVWALASGLARKVVEKVAGPLDVKVIEEQVKPPPPPEKVVPPPPDLKAPPPPFVPPPEFLVTAPAPPAPAIQSTQVAPPAAAVVAPQAPVAAAPAPAPRPAVITAAMVCTKMSKPEVPSVNFSGEAAFKVVATVKAGKVSGFTFTNLRAGVDRKVQRAFQSEIETALQAYVCPGDHVFEQEFVFRID
ncbi:hypothetical protein [Roseateles paludis]|uniref:Energy transducer TonB n=1 Tax=Roseateles paludis TaxID=3145238 RepID=A0ABV0G156_9BURK